LPGLRAVFVYAFGGSHGTPIAFASAACPCRRAACSVLSLPFNLLKVLHTVQLVCTEYPSLQRRQTYLSFFDNSEWSQQVHASKTMSESPCMLLFYLTQLVFEVPSG
jgi:hypothetical protein